MARGKRIWHFATKADYEPVLMDISEQMRLKFVVYEERLQPTDFRVYGSPLEAPEFGVSSQPDWIQGIQFLVLPENAPLHFEYWPNRQVPEKYGFFGQQGNDQSVVFHPSSFYHGEKGEGLLWGEINTISEHPDSLAIFDAFKKSIRKHFERIDVCYVGDEAAKYLDAGGRLTQDLRAPCERDIQRA